MTNCCDKQEQRISLDVSNYAEALARGLLLFYATEAECAREKRGTFRYAENGRDAVQAASRQTFDIVLMDVQMPEMDGLEATRRIRRAGRQPSIPIVAFTGYHGGAEREKCFSAGMTAYLAKPVDRRTLIEMLEGLCDPT